MTSYDERIFRKAEDGLLRRNLSKSESFFSEAKSTLSDSSSAGITPFAESDSSSCVGGSSKFEFIMLKRKKLEPINSNLVSKCKCGLIFDWYNRKHHCRACGDVFCSDCTCARMKIPKPLVCYLNTSGWWTPDMVCRICKPCSIKIINYEMVSEDLKKLYNEPPLLDSIKFVMVKQTNTTTFGINTINEKALSYYLSEMRQIQYLFPSDKLSPEYINFLKINKECFRGHSYWLMQLLKVENNYNNIIEPIGNDNIQTLCTRGCRPTLRLSDAMMMLLFDDLYQNQTIAWNIINNSSYEEIERYLPIILHSQLKNTSDKAIKLTSGNKEFNSSVYWHLNAIDHPLTEILRSKLIPSIEEDIVNFRYLINIINKILEGKIAEDFNWHSSSIMQIVYSHQIYSPFYPNEKIKLIEKVWMGSSKSKPIFIEYYAERGGMTVKRVILYKKEDVRKDSCIVRLVKELSRLVGCECVTSYNVLPISINSGVIEIVPSCSTLSHIYRNGSLSNFLQKYNPDQTVKNIQTAYRDSLAFWTIITYILGIGDRHFDNIMVTFSGNLFHIDFDFIFGKDSKFYAPKIRLNSYMIEGLGGEDKYQEFKEICERYFMHIRQNIDMVYALLMNLTVASPSLGLTDDYLKEHLNRSFFIGESDEIVRDRLEFIIDECKDSFVGGINDYIHTAAKSTSGIFSLFS